MNFEMFVRDVSYYGTWALGLGALLVVAVFLWFLGIVWLKYVLEKQKYSYTIFTIGVESEG